MIGALANRPHTHHQAANASASAMVNIHPVARIAALSTIALLTIPMT